MPAFHTHTIWNLVLLSPLTVGLYLGVESGKIDYVQGAALVGGFVASTFMLSPDLDLATSAISKHWGKLAFVTKPYSKAFHHGQASHKPVLGTLTRYLYLGIILAILLGITWLVVPSMGGKIATTLQSNWTLILFAFVGSLVADSIHEFLDAVTTYHKSG